jgi:hypothetical protein
MVVTEEMEEMVQTPPPQTNLEVVEVAEVLEVQVALEE